MSSSSEDEVRRTWKFLTNHAHTLVCIAQDSGIRIQDIADRVGITLRAAQSIVGDLVDAGYVTARASDDVTATRCTQTSRSATRSRRITGSANCSPYSPA